MPSSGLNSNKNGSPNLHLYSSTVPYDNNGTRIELIEGIKTDLKIRLDPLNLFDPCPVAVVCKYEMPRSLPQQPPRRHRSAHHQPHEVQPGGLCAQVEVFPKGSRVGELKLRDGPPQ